MSVFELVSTTLQPFYIKIVVAAIIFVFGLILGQLASRLVNKLLCEMMLDKLIRKATGMRLKLEALAAAAVKYFIYFVFVIWALERIGLGSIVLNILASGIIIIIIIAFLLGIKDFIPNAVAGIYLQLKGIVRKGEHIMCQDVAGKVLEVDLVETKIETESGDRIYIPNSNLLKNRVVKRKS